MSERNDSFYRKFYDNYLAKARQYNRKSYAKRLAEMHRKKSSTRGRKRKPETEGSSHDWLLSTGQFSKNSGLEHVVPESEK